MQSVLEVKPFSYENSCEYLEMSFQLFSMHKDRKDCALFKIDQITITVIFNTFKVTLIQK